jgi:hypothetical protein
MTGRRGGIRQRVRRLVLEVLDELPRPLREDVTDDVLCEIATNPNRFRRYEELCRDAARGDDTVLKEIGRAVRELLDNPPRISRSYSPKNRLSSSYTKLAI